MLIGKIFNLLTTINIDYVAHVWQDGEEENKTKDSSPAGRTGLRSSTTSVTKSKRLQKKVTAGKKPAAQKPPSVTLTQMVGNSDSKRVQTVADTENVCLILFAAFFYRIFSS